MYGLFDRDNLQARYIQNGHTQSNQACIQIPPVSLNLSSQQCHKGLLSRFCCRDDWWGTSVSRSMNEYKINTDELLVEQGAEREEVCFKTRIYNSGINCV